MTITQERHAEGGPDDFEHHRAELAAITGAGSAQQQVRYAYEALSDMDPDGPTLMDWLARHDAPVGRSTVYSTLKLCRAEAGRPDTGPMPSLNAETLAELDAARARSLAESGRGPAAAEAGPDHGPESGPESEAGSDSVQSAPVQSGRGLSAAFRTALGPAGPGGGARPQDGPHRAAVPAAEDSAADLSAAESTESAQAVTGPTLVWSAPRAESEAGPAAPLDPPDQTGPASDPGTDAALDRSEQETHKDGFYPLSGETLEGVEPGITQEVQQVQESSKAGVSGQSGETQKLSWRVTGALYFVALATLPISLNTSVRFFEKVMHISSTWELALMAAVMELTLVVCGIAMVHSVRRFGSPGAFQTVVWGICAFAGWTALHMSDSLGEAVARVVLGPVTGAIMLHLALGLVKRTHHNRTGVIARVGREFRERALSLLGLGDDERDAAQRTRDRAGTRMVRLSRPRRWRWSRAARLERAALAAGIADDPALRARVMARRQVLAELDQGSLWTD